MADDFGDDWEPDAAAVAVVSRYLQERPEQGEWYWNDHCDGLAGGILSALREAGFDARRYRAVGWMCEWPESAQAEPPRSFMLKAPQMDEERWEPIYAIERANTQEGT